MTQEERFYQALNGLKNEFTGYAEHERKRALQAQRRDDLGDYQYHTIYANAYKNVAYTIDRKIKELQGE